MLTLIRSRRRRNVSKFAGNNFLKKQPLTTILSDGVPAHKRFGAPSDEGYCKSEVFEVILVETPGLRVKPYPKLYHQVNLHPEDLKLEEISD